MILGILLKNGIARPRRSAVPFLRRIPFDAIEAQFGLKEDQVIDVMRPELEPARFRARRKRAPGLESEGSSLEVIQTGCLQVENAEDRREHQTKLTPFSKLPKMPH